MPTRRRAFTLVELLVVIGVIALLIALLMPALSRVREQARGVKCSSNMRQLMFAALHFAAEHNGRLPGNEGEYSHPDPEKRCWVFNQIGKSQSAEWQTAPESGTLWPYVKDRGVYLCPSRILGGEGSTKGDGYGNGLFDYSIVKAFAGARVVNIRATSTWRYEPSRTTTVEATPYLVEETAYRVNYLNIDGAFCNFDEHSAHHGGGSFYASIDGSVRYFMARKRRNPPDQWGDRALAGQWTSVSPARGTVELGTARPTWGWWDKTN